MSKVIMWNLMTIDEFRIGLVPVVLGSGTPLFRPGPDPTKPKLVDSRPTQTGCVILYYRPEGLDR